MRCASSYIVPEVVPTGMQLFFVRPKQNKYRPMQHDAGDRSPRLPDTTTPHTDSSSSLPSASSNAMNDDYRRMPDAAPQLPSNRRVDSYGTVGGGGGGDGGIRTVVRANPTLGERLLPAESAPRGVSPQPTLPPATTAATGGAAADGRRAIIGSR
jgi:hypothetical protein